MDDLLFQSKFIRPIIKSLAKPALLNLINALTDQTRGENFIFVSVNCRSIVFVVNTAIRGGSVSYKDLTEDTKSVLLTCLNHSSSHFRGLVLDVILKNKLWYKQKLICSKLEEHFQWSLSIPLSAATSNAICRIASTTASDCDSLSLIQCTILESIMSENLDYATVLSRVKMLRMIIQKCTGSFKDKAKIIKHLLDLTKGSPFELVRTAACNSLIEMDWTFDEVDPGYSAEALMEVAQNLISQSLTVPRLRGATLYRLLMHKLSIIELSNPPRVNAFSKSDLISTNWIQFFLTKASTQIDLIDSDFENILNGNPLHGSMECLLHAINLAGDHSDESLIDSLTSISSRVFSVTNSYFDSKLSLGGGTDTLEESTDDSGLDSTTCPIERMTSAIWRSCKCASQLLLALVQLIPEGYKSSLIMDSGKFMMELLFRTRHWGLAQHIQISFDALLAKSTDSSILTEWIQV